jgi:hypothetical protein
MKTSFKNIWVNQEIEAQANTTRNKVVINNTNCYVGRVGASNAKMFQIEISNSIPIHKNYLKRFCGVEIRILESNSDKKDITIILSDNDLLDLFILFLNDLSGEIETISSEDEIPAIINKKVSYWGKLFARINGELLSKERQRGLYGELTFLHSLLNSSSSQTKSMIAWTGPEGSNQDFSNQISATEIKTSKATKPTVNIASELQLDWTVLENLFLVIVHIDEISNGTNTLKKLIEEIKELILNQSELLQLFEEKLDRVGIPYGEEEHYDDTGFVIRSQKAYQVKEGFPALTTEIINNVAIHNIQYQIDITACEPFEITLENVINEML